MGKKPTTIGPCKTEVTYLDNNSTVKICPPARAAVVKWLDSRANPSSDSIIARNAKAMVDSATSYVLRHSGVTPSAYTALFTSGASESNCLVLRSLVEAYRRSTGRRPHIVTSATEHKSVIQCCNSMRDDGYADITYVEPTAYGCIDPALVERAITANTALISIMAANNEIGCINALKEIGDIAHARNIPFHSDASQLYGKYKIPLVSSRIDALSASFHKLGGPMGIGLLILSNALITGYGIRSQISGTQQQTLRGGTENVPAIAGAVAALCHAFEGRPAKNKRMYQLKRDVVSGLERILPRGTYKSYFEGRKPTRNEFVVLGPTDSGSHITPNVLPNTLLIAFAKNKMFAGGDNAPFCNSALKKCLDRQNIIIAVGSACNTSSPKASHVLSAIKAPPVIVRGVIRISLADTTTQGGIKRLVACLAECVAKQMPLD